MRTPKPGLSPDEWALVDKLRDEPGAWSNGRGFRALAHAISEGRTAGIVSPEIKRKRQVSPSWVQRAMRKRVKTQSVSKPDGAPCDGVACQNLPNGCHTLNRMATHSDGGQENRESARVMEPLEPVKGGNQTDAAGPATLALMATGPPVPDRRPETRFQEICPSCLNAWGKHTQAQMDRCANQGGDAR